MPIPKVVADTNVWVAARFNPKSYSAKILNLAGEGRVKLLWSVNIKEELERILANVKATPDFMEATKRLLDSSTYIDNTEELHVIESDPDDNKILACAKAGGADYIITNDDHLLSLKSFGHTQIVTPKEFIVSLNHKRVM